MYIYKDYPEECSFWDNRFHLVGRGNRIVNNSIISLELDLSSEEKEKRMVRYIIDNSLEECYFCGIPESVKIGVYFYIHICIYIYLIIF